MKILKEVQKECMEEEVWEFMEKHILPVLMVTSATTTDREGAKSGSNAPNADLYTCLLHRAFLCLKEITTKKVCYNAC